MKPPRVPRRKDSLPLRAACQGLAPGVEMVAVLGLAADTGTGIPEPPADMDPESRSSEVGNQIVPEVAFVPGVA